MNAEAPSNKSSTLQHMERLLDTKRARSSVDSPDRRHAAAGDSTEVFLFHTARPYNSGIATGIVRTHFKAQVRTTRRRRRYLRTSRATRSQIQRAAHIYNEYRKAGHSTNEAVLLVRTEVNPGPSPVTVETGSYVRAPRTITTLAAGLVLCAFLGADRSTTPAVTVATGVAFLAAAIARALTFKSRRADIPVAGEADSPELFTHTSSHGSFGTFNTPSTPIHVRRSSDVRGAAHPSTRTRRSGNSGRGVRVDDMGTAPMAKATPPQEGARSLQCVED